MAPRILTLLWKNFILRKRHFVMTALEIILPSFFLLSIVIVKILLARSLGEGSQKEVIPEDTVKSLDYRILIGRIKGRTVAYTPDNPFTAAIARNMKTFGSRLKLIPYPDEDTIEEEIASQISSKSSSTFTAAVIFKEGFSSTPDPSASSLKLAYKIRVTRRGQAAPTDLIFPSQNQLGSQYLLSYIASGFSGLQILVDRAILKFFSNKPIPHYLYKCAIRTIPITKEDDDIVTPYLLMTVPIFVALGHIVLIPAVLVEVVGEKETGIKELMRMMGLPNWMHLIGWVINFLLTALLSASLMVMMLFLGESPLLRIGEYYLFWLVLVLYNVQTVAMCLLIAAFFERVIFAITIGLIISLLSTVLYAGLANYFYPFFSTEMKLFFCILPNGGLLLLFKIMLDFEKIGLGATFEVLDKPLNSFPGDTLTIQIILLVMALTSVFYWILALYFESILPSTFGVRRPWYYPVLLSTWMNRAGPAARRYSRGSVNKGINFEGEPGDIEIGIEVKRLRKVFGGGNIFGLNGKKILGVDIGKVLCLGRRPEPEKIAVDIRTLNIFKGQITVLLGHNGAGKTTLMSMLTGIVAPTSGVAIVNGYNISKNMSAARKSLGLCPQHNMLFSKLTVYEHLVFFAKLKGSNQDTKAEIDALLTNLQFPEKRHEPSSTLSGGQKRKLNLAIALVGGSKTVILDEPSSGMDPEARRAVWDVLTEARSSRTILLTTHFMEEADFLGDRIAIMNSGRLSCCGSPMFLKRRYGTGYILRANLSSNSTKDDILNVVRTYIPEATLQASQNVSEIAIALTALETSSVLPKLFADLEEKQQDLQIIALGLTFTTMDDIFVNVVTDANVGKVLPPPGILFIPSVSGSELGDKAPPEDPAIPDPALPSAAVPKKSVSIKKPPPLGQGKLKKSVVAPATSATALYALSATSVSKTTVKDGESWTLSEQQKKPPHLGALATARNPVTLLSKPKDTRRRQSTKVHIHINLKNSHHPPKSVTSDSSLEALPLPVASSASDFFVPIGDPDQQGSSRPPKKSTGLKLVCLQFKAMLLKRFWYTTRKKSLLLFQVLMPLTLTCLGIYLSNITIKVQSPKPPLLIKLSSYNSPMVLYKDKEPEQRPSLGAAYEQVVGPAAAKVNTDLVAALILASDEDFVKFRGSYVVAADFSSRPTALFSTIPYHSLPLSMNLMHNAVLKLLVPKMSIEIQVTNHPLRSGIQEVFDSVDRIRLGQPWVTIGLAFAPLACIGLSLCAAVLVTFPVEERVTQVKQLELMTGINPIIFWIASFLFDYFIMVLISCLLLVCLPILQLYKVYTAYDGGWMMLLILLVFDFAAVSFAYLVSLFTSSPAKGFAFIATTNLFYGFLMVLSVRYTFQYLAEDLGYLWPRKIFPFLGRLVPIYGLMSGLIMFSAMAGFNSRCMPLTEDHLTILCNHTTRVDGPEYKACCPDKVDLPECSNSNNSYVEQFCRISRDPYPCFKSASYFKWWLGKGDYCTEQSGILLELLYSFLMGLLYLIIVLCNDFGVFRYFGVIINRKISERNREEVRSSTEVELDPDVVREQLRVKASLHQGPLDAIVLNHLKKLYGTFMAVTDLSFGVYPGECFGLLGVNGAGKTTTFNMITGATVPSSGNVYLSGCSIGGTTYPECSLSGSGKEFLKAVGYCPQVDTIIGILTGYEMLQIFGLLRGRQNAKTEAMKWLTKFGLEKSRNVASKDYSGGMKRRLCAAMAMIGDPPIVLLDEPTSGVDPVSRRQFWEILENVQKFGQTVILTSHSMDECEALCGRLAIMVNGQLQCLGGTGHIKRKFGKGFVITIKLKTSDPSEPGSQADMSSLEELKGEVLEKFDPCQLTDEHQHILQYRGFNSHMLWSLRFEIAEDLQTRYSALIEDYTIHDANLEEVFLSFARMQYPTRQAKRRCCIC